MSERDKAIEMPDGWDGTPVIKLPVHYKNGFVIDADKQIVCNLLWNSHRVNYDARDQAGEYVANCINHAKQNAEAENVGKYIRIDQKLAQKYAKLEAFVNGLTSATWGIMNGTMLENWHSLTEIVVNGNTAITGKTPLEAIYAYLEQAEGGEE